MKYFSPFYRALLPCVTRSTIFGLLIVLCFLVTTYAQQEHFPNSPISAMNSSAGGGSIDPSFNASVTDGLGQMNETVVQPDGKVIAVGQLQHALAQPCTFPVFETGKTFATGAWPWAIAKGDVNNDGKLDVVNTNFDGNSVSTLLGTGDGNFQPRIDSPANSRPTGLFLYELNGDGKLDAIVLNAAGSDKITALLGDGSGNFALTAAYSIYNPLGLQVVDANNDGKLDLIVIAGDGYIGKIAIYTGTGSGSFNVPIVYNLPNGASSTLEVGDYNEDGKVDFIYSTTSGIFVWSGDGAGNFAQSWAWTQNYGGISPGNLNADQFIDFAVLDGTFNRMWIFAGNGDGTFTRQNSFPVGDVGGQGPAVDINQDGWDDLTAKNWSSNEFSVLLARGDGTFSSAVHYTTSGEPTGLLIADFSGDGNLDVITASAKEILGHGRNNHIKLTLGRGDGTFIAPINYPIFPGAFPTVAKISDLNGDGKDDVLVGVSSQFGLSVFLRTGAFRFAPRRDFLPNTPIRDFVVRDFNDDGKSDVLGVAGGWAYSLRGDGHGGLSLISSFQLQPGYDGPWAVAMTVDDFDHDNKLDFVVGTRYGAGHLFYFRGAGDGTFGPATQYSATLEPVVDIASADLNGDSYADLVVLYDTFLALYPRVEIWMNNGMGQFALGNQYSSGFSGHPGRLAMGDFNNDGYTDFAATFDFDAGTPAYVRTFHGSGNGSFTSTARFNAGGWQPRDILAGDFNADGKVDLATTNDSSEDVSVFRGTGLGDFAVEQKISAGEQSREMAAGNLNSDSSPDLIVTNYNGSTFTMMPNGCNKAVEPPNIASLFDYDGDGKADRTVRRPSNDLWYLLRTTVGYTAMAWGVAGDLLAPADYDGDGKTDIAVFRPATGTWHIVNSSNGAFLTYNWGADGDLPVPADHNADGKADLVLFRQSDGMFYRRMSDNSFSNVSFGVAGDKPLIGDFDKDGQFDIGVYRPSNNNWYLRKSTAGFFVQTWGEAGDVPVPADYDGDGQTDLAVWRPSNGRWYRAQSTAGFDGVNWGEPGDKPVPADYDGDGKTDVAIFRPSTGTWYMIGTTIGQLVQQFGQDGDVPTPSAFIY